MTSASPKNSGGPGSPVWLGFQPIPIRALIVVSGLFLAANLLYVLFPEVIFEYRDLDEPARTLVKQLDLGREGNAATWWTASLLLLNGLAAYTLARRQWPADRNAAIASFILMAGFFLLSLGDVARLHEHVEDLAGDWLEAQDLSDRRIYLGFAGTLAIALTAIVTWGYRRLLSRRHVALLAGAVGCVLASVVAEWVEDTLDCRSKSVCHRVEVVFEEGGELLAILLFLGFQALLLARQASAGRSGPARG